jgi:hypothetical protein
MALNILVIVQGLSLHHLLRGVKEVCLLRFSTIMVVHQRVLSELERQKQRRI